DVFCGPFMPAGSGTWRVGAGSWRASCAVTAALALVAEPQLVESRLPDGRLPPLKKCETDCVVVVPAPPPVPVEVPVEAEDAPPEPLVDPPDPLPEVPPEPPDPPEPPVPPVGLGDGADEVRL